MRYAIIRDEDDITIMTHNGGVGTIHNTGECMLAEMYQDRPEKLTTDYSMYEELSEGNMYAREFGYNVDEAEIIQSILTWLCPMCRTFTLQDTLELIEEYNRGGLDSEVE